MFFEIISNNWMSKSWISTQIQDRPQILVFEMVYLFLRTVFEITRSIRGTQIGRKHIQDMFEMLPNTCRHLETCVVIFEKILGPHLEHRKTVDPL